MKDLTECKVCRDDFQRWLGLGTAPFTIMKGEKATATLSKLEKSPSVDYLYRIAMERDNSVSWDSSLAFCGVYDRQNRALYLTKDTLRLMTDGSVPFVEEIKPSMAEAIRSGINLRVEETIKNDRNNLPVREIIDRQMLRDLQYHREYGAKSDAIRRFFNGEIPDGQFHSAYKLDGLQESAFMSYLQDPKGFIQTEAETYIKKNQEKFLLQFLESDALLAEYQALVQDTANPIHRMKAITDAVRSSGAKSVTVTVQKDGQELTFKAAADYITGHRNSYSTSSMPAPDRREFERLFGRHADYNAEDVVRITYGRNAIYEAPSVQTEDMAEEIGMGGMQFG